MLEAVTPSNHNGLSGRYFRLHHFEPNHHELADIRMLSNFVFYSFWKRQLAPYKQLQERDTIYLVDSLADLIVAEVRVAAVGRFEYERQIDAYRYLANTFGVERPAHGWDEYDPQLESGYVFAVLTEPIEYLNIPFDINWRSVGAQSGWAAAATVAGSAKVSEQQKRFLFDALPQPGREPAVRAYPVNTGGAPDLTDISRAPRSPTSAVKAEVLVRSEGRCEQPGCEEEGSHFDHIYPWIRGGSSDLVNIQLLCQTHNLAKSDRIPDTWDPRQLWINFAFCSEDFEDVFAIGSGLEGREVRTDNSIYDVVIDDDRVYVWKRGTRTVYVDAFVEESDAIRESGPNGYRQLVLGYDGDTRRRTPGSFLRTSNVTSVTNADPVVALARLGKKPGDVI